jgi:UDP-N-acetylmuramoyl-tripeptide--D-alanyl-D-alanine ligase
LATPIPENHVRFTAAEIARATGGRPVELDSGLSITAVVTDSRAARAGARFVALRGETHDGHRFVEAARARGAVALVAAGAGLAGPRIEVDDTLAALGALARAHVDRELAEHGARPVLAIGGAAGKTTTKTLAAAAVRALFGEILLTEGNLNNRIGVPMTLLTLAPEHRALVLECGTSVPGEIAALGAIVRPDVALVLNVGIEHSQGLGTLDEIADEEAALFAVARRAAITSTEEPLLTARLARTSTPLKLTFGTDPSADLRLAERSIRADGRASLLFQLGERLSARTGTQRTSSSPAVVRSSALAAGQAAARPPVLPIDESLSVFPVAESPSGLETEGSLLVVTPLLGAAAAANVGAALAGALALLGRPARAAELEAVAAALAAVEAVPGRLCPRTIGGRLVLDDSYNSNPKSLAAGLEAARELAARRATPLVLALGDMLELGRFAAGAHDDMVRAADACGAAHLLLVGPESTAAAERVRPVSPCSTWPDSATAADALPALLQADELIFVKGSRGTRMERLLETLEGEVR